jgi:hypothetical protein
MGMAYRWEFDDLVRRLQEAESLAHAIGMHTTAHVINDAKNRAGWEFAGVEPPADKSRATYHAPDAKQSQAAVDAERNLMAQTITERIRHYSVLDADHAGAIGSDAADAIMAIRRRAQSGEKE